MICETNIPGNQGATSAAKSPDMHAVSLLIDALLALDSFAATITVKCTRDPQSAALTIAKDLDEDYNLGCLTRI